MTTPSSSKESAFTESHPETEQGPNQDLALSRLNKAEVVLADLDGCLATANIPLPGARELAQQLGDKLYIVSNNSRDLSEGLSAQLRQQGMAVAAGNILLAGHLTVELIAQQTPGGRVQFFGSDELAELARNLGLNLTDDQPDVVMLSRDTSFTYDKLQCIARSLKSGARLIVSNPDLTHPGPDGVPVPETGALLAAVRSVAPGLPEENIQIIGKPEPAIYLAALQKAGGVAPQKAVMLGDNPLTDVAGATALGMPAILLGPHPGALVSGVSALLRD
ncbi:HAD-IIA family hydrolase [Rhodovibrionaceae bacterium A322]